MFENPLIVGLLIIAVLSVVGGLVYVGLREDSGRDPLQDRLAEFGDRDIPQSLSEIEMELSFRDRVLLPALKTVADVTTRFTPNRQIEQTRRQIELAGMAGQMDPTVFFAMRILLTIVLTIAAFFVFFISSDSTSTLLATVYTLAAALLGFFLPVMYLASRIKRRQDSIVKALPDALDLLVICVEAGLGFDQAMGKVYEKWDNDLAVAFGRVLREIQLGKIRREALRDMSSRMDVPDVTSFIAAITQADQLGVPMGKILRVQSDQMRVKRRQRAQEKAQQAPVKMMIPMVFLIFPSMFIIFLGPAFIKLMESPAFAMF